MRLALNYQRVDPTRGGAETYVVDLCQHLVQLGHSVDLYAETWREGALPAEVRCVPVEVTGRTRSARLRSFARNSELALDQETYDCTIGLINTWHHDVIIPQGGVHRGSLEANAKRFPAGLRRSLYRLGKMINPKFWTYEAIEKKQYDPHRQARVIAVSHMVKSHLQEYHNLTRSRIHVIPNAIDASRLHVSHPEAVRCAFRNQLGIKPGDLVGLFVGHNFALKGLRPLLKALARRAEQNPGGRAIHLIVCGGGKVRAYRRFANRLGLGQTIHWLGFAPEIPPCFWASDFFVLPTYYDPCSLVVFEALACGLPVITTSCNGAGEIMTDGREGYLLTEPDAIGELVDALERMTDDDARLVMSRHARELGQEQTFDHHVARLIQVFLDVAGTRHRKTPHTPRSGQAKKLAR